MKRALLFAAATLWAAPLLAAEYIWINPDGASRIYNSPPVDLTYPPPGVATTFVDKARGDPTRGKPESLAQARARVNSGMLVILIEPRPKTSTRAAFERTGRDSGVSTLVPGDRAVR